MQTDHPITFSIHKDLIPYGDGRFVHHTHPHKRGVAYIQNGFFVCMLAHASGLWGIAPGLSFTQRAAGQLEDWVTQTFAAQDIIQMARLPGECTRLLWRPGLDGLENVSRYLLPDSVIMNESGVTLSLLLSRFDDIVQFIHLDARNLSSFGHQLREFLILACTEVEASFRGVMAASTLAVASDSHLTTKDYYRLCEPMHLREFSIELRQYPSIPKVRPFLHWEQAKPTKSLEWYDAYNAVKHDRANSLHQATLGHCIDALAAVAAVYCAQFCIPEGGDWMHEPAFELNDWFKVELVDPDPSLYYVPPVKIAADRPAGLWSFDGRGTDSWLPRPLNL